MSLMEIRALSGSSALREGAAFCSIIVAGLQVSRTGMLDRNRSHPICGLPAPGGLTPTLKGKPLRNRISRALLHVAIPACAVLAACVITPAAADAADGPFAEFSGSWSGAGTLRPENGAPERIRCNANYRQRGSSHRDIDLQLRCASDSYNFDLSGQFSADAQNQVSGQWTERTRSVGGTAVGNANGDRVQLHVEAPGFSAEVIMITRSKRQSVTIDSHGGGQVVKASISLSRS
ncbi:MAG TPA: hypothetical protein VFB29_12375 [Pseudolabrys sp.]|nr:hypothetical protein [Pseudolabrys sp.]